MKRKSIGAIIIYILLITWCVVIFVFSAQPADTSSWMSSGVAKRLYGFLRYFSIGKVGDDVSLLNESFETVLRKAAHVFEYAVLGILACMAAKRLFDWYPKLMAAAFGLMYAITDEVHQFFVEGRSCEARDVAIDFLGVLLGVLVFYLTKIIHEAIHSGKENKTKIQWR